MTYEWPSLELACLRYEFDIPAELSAMHITPFRAVAVTKADTIYYWDTFTRGRAEVLKPSTSMHGQKKMPYFSKGSHISGVRLSPDGNSLCWSNCTQMQVTCGMPTVNETGLMEHEEDKEEIKEEKEDSLDEETNKETKRCHVQ